MRKQKEDNKDSESANFEWFEKVENIVGSFIRGLAGGFAERINQRLHEFYSKLQKNIAGSILIMVGFVFSLIGIAIFINDLIGFSRGLGYSIVGIGSLLIGLIIIKK